LRDKYTHAYSGFETQSQAEFWLEEAEMLWKKGQPDWKDWQMTSTVLRQNGIISAEFTAEYSPQQ
jgi:hypothetical protein